MDTYLKIEKELLKHGKFYISLELDRVNRVLRELDNPQEKLKVIHIAGTNGKGSTCAMINQILIEQGYKTGLYTSPHLIKYNERIKINNKNISDERFFKLIEKIKNITKKINVDLTEFEILTTVMYQYFYEEQVEFAVVEVGLGGRFDATNCISRPLISIITSISLDHTERLGNTVEKITKEKAGIIKDNCSIIFNKSNKGYKYLDKISREKNAVIQIPKTAQIIPSIDKNIIKYGNKKYELNLSGTFQKENSELALCCIDTLRQKGIKIEEKSVYQGLKKVRWNGRFEYIKDKNIIIDGCHNPDGARALRESLDLYFKDYKKTFLYTSLKNKDYKSIQEILFTQNDTIYHIDTKSERFIKKEDTKNCSKSININEIKKLANKIRDKEILIICGSLYAIGDILCKIELCNF